MSELVTKTFKLPRKLAQEVADSAKARGVSESEFIRKSLESALSREADDGIDMAVALRDFIGSVRGPRDLSTNRKHMKGYGRSRNR